MKDLISVIVPVYQVADYLPQCVDSILCQDHQALEVILIDDGSRDGSSELCDRYAGQDSRVRVIHQKNAGAGAAKNAGLRIASGEYLSFVDSDDFLQPKVYGYMLEVLKQSRAEAAVFSFRDVYPRRTQDHSDVPGRQMMTAKAYLERFLEDWTCALLWNKLYRRELFDGIFFPEGRKIDDEFFTYRGILNAKTVVRDDRIVYNYRRRASSVMGSPKARGQRMMDRIDALAQRREEVIRRFPDLRKAYDIAYVDALCYMSEYPDNSAESLTLLKKLLKDYLFHLGNTLPPKHLWRGILRLSSGSVETLLAQLPPGNCETPEEYYP